MEDILVGNKYRTEKYDETKINMLSGMIADNPRLLLVITRIVSNFQNQKAVKEESEALQVILKNAIRKYDINSKLLNEFGELWIEMDDREIGFVLEDFIMKIGCFDQTIERPQKLRDFMIYNISSQEDIVNGTYSKKNFDVLFCQETGSEYNKNLKRQITQIKGDVEFHECKKNISNCIPVSIEKEIDIQDKLDFMKEVYEWMVKSKKYITENRFFIPTFTYNSLPQQEHLINKGYEFIKILDLKMMIEEYIGA